MQMHQVRADVSNLFVVFRYDNLRIDLLRLHTFAMFAYVLVVYDDKANPSTKAVKSIFRPVHDSPKTIPTANARLPSLCATKRKNWMQTPEKLFE